jgi:hypothetical protein
MESVIWWDIDARGGVNFEAMGRSALMQQLEAASKTTSDQAFML